MHTHRNSSNNHVNGRDRRTPRRSSCSSSSSHDIFANEATSVQLPSLCDGARLWGSSRISRNYGREKEETRPLGTIGLKTAVDAQPFWGCWHPSKRCARSIPSSNGCPCHSSSYVNSERGMPCSTKGTWEQSVSALHFDKKNNVIS